MRLAVDCACVIHGDYYDWQYVECLYNMLQANCSYEVRLHVYTESERPVPDHVIKHSLIKWPNISGPRRSWWYKMQLFDNRHFSGQLLYLDLDTVIVGNIDWIWNLNTDHFCAVHDFRRLWKPNWIGINSSVMLWNTDQYHWIWEDFSNTDINSKIKQFHGDQDFLNHVILHDTNFSYFDHAQIKSWRWQVLDGGLDPQTRRYHSPGKGAVIDPNTSIICFHGQPKPHESKDPTILRFWHV